MATRCSLCGGGIASSDMGQKSGSRAAPDALLARPPAVEGTMDPAKARRGLPGPGVGTRACVRCERPAACRPASQHYRASSAGVEAPEEPARSAHSALLARRARRAASWPSAPGSATKALCSRSRTAGRRSPPGGRPAAAAAAACPLARRQPPTGPPACSSVRLPCRSTAPLPPSTARTGPPTRGRRWVGWVGTASAWRRAASADSSPAAPGSCVRKRRSSLPPCPLPHLSLLPPGMEQQQLADRGRRRCAPLLPARAVWAAFQLGGGALRACASARCSRAASGPLLPAGRILLEDYQVADEQPTLTRRPSPCALLPPSPLRPGPILLEDYQLVEKLANFDRERIPERVVHARGAAAKGFFEVRGRAGGGLARHSGICAVPLAASGRWLARQPCARRSAVIREGGRDSGAPAQCLQVAAAPGTSAVPASQPRPSWRVWVGCAGTRPTGCTSGSAAGRAQGTQARAERHAGAPVASACGCTAWCAGRRSAPPAWLPLPGCVGRHAAASGKAQVRAWAVLTSLMSAPATAGTACAPWRPLVPTRESTPPAALPRSCGIGEEWAGRWQLAAFAPGCVLAVEHLQALAGRRPCSSKELRGSNARSPAGTRQQPSQPACLAGLLAVAAFLCAVLPWCRCMFCRLSARLI